MSTRRKALSLVLGALALMTAVVGLALAQEMSPPDHDYALAESMFGQNPDCPPGRVHGVSEWETLAEREALITPPPGVDMGTPPPLDFVEVIPHDPAPYLKGVSEVPSGFVAVVACVSVGPDRLVLADDAANLFGTADSAAPSEE